MMATISLIYGLIQGNAIQSIAIYALKKEAVPIIIQEITKEEPKEIYVPIPPPFYNGGKLK